MRGGVKGKLGRSEELGSVCLSERGEAGSGVGGRDRKIFRLVSVEAVYNRVPR